MNHTSQEIGVRSTGYQASGTAIAKEVSEIDREAQGVDSDLKYLEMRLSILRDRLQPVIRKIDAGQQVGPAGAIPPSSDLGGQLRTYANRAKSIAETVDYLLEHLALA